MESEHSLAWRVNFVTGFAGDWYIPIERTSQHPQFSRVRRYTPIERWPLNSGWTWPTLYTIMPRNASPLANFPFRCMLRCMQDSVSTNSVTKVVAALTELIFTGQLPTGAPVREVELATRLAVSRTPVREAIAQLVSRGLLTKKDGHSARVHQPSLEDLTEIYELRRITESFLAAQAAISMDSKCLNKLSKLEEKLRTTSGDEWFVHHRNFHKTITEAANRPRFDALVEDLRRQSEPYIRLVTNLDTAHRNQAALEHTGLLQAMAAADSEKARELTETHLQSTVDRVTFIFSAARGLLTPTGSR